MSHIKESCPIWMSHVPYEWVIYLSLPIVCTTSDAARVIFHINESCPTWMSHVFSPTNASCNLWYGWNYFAHKRVMSHMKESCPIWMSHLFSPANCSCNLWGGWSILVFPVTSKYFAFVRVYVCVCAYVCVCVCVYTCMCVQPAVMRLIYTHILSDMYVFLSDMYSFMYVFSLACIHAYTHACMYANVHAYMDACIYTRMHAHTINSTHCIETLDFHWIHIKYLQLTYIKCNISHLLNVSPECVHPNALC